MAVVENTHAHTNTISTYTRTDLNTYMYIYTGHIHLQKHPYTYILPYTNTGYIYKYNIGERALPTDTYVFIRVYMYEQADVYVGADIHTHINI